MIPALTGLYNIALDLHFIVNYLTAQSLMVTALGLINWWNKCALLSAVTSEAIRGLLKPKRPII